MIEKIKEFFESDSDLSHGEMWQIDEDLANLEWENISGKISNEDYLRQVILKNEKPLRNSINFRKNTKKFSEFLKFLFGENLGKTKFLHELEHAKICDKHKIDYFFRISKFNDIETTLQPFIQVFDEDLVLLEPRERILFLIENNRAPKDMSSGDLKMVGFWEGKLIEFDRLNNFKNTSQ